jgi:hypothetical protein
LDQTASSLHSGSDKLSGVAHSAADKIQATADYVRRTDLKAMAEDVQDLVERYPGGHCCLMDEDACRNLVGAPFALRQLNLLRSLAEGNLDVD